MYICSSGYLSAVADNELFACGFLCDSVSTIIPFPWGCFYAAMLLTLMSALCWLFYVVLFVVFSLAFESD